jgi:hypothetical protein
VHKLSHSYIVLILHETYPIKSLNLIPNSIWRRYWRKFIETHGWSREPNRSKNAIQTQNGKTSIVNQHPFSGNWSLNFFLFEELNKTGKSCYFTGKYAQWSKIINALVGKKIKQSLEDLQLPGQQKQFHAHSNELSL